MAESYTGEAYCVKCKEKREFTGEVVERRPPDGAGHLPRVRHQAQPHPRQGLTLHPRPWRPSRTAGRAHVVPGPVSAVVPAPARGSWL